MGKLMFRRVERRCTAPSSPPPGGTTMKSTSLYFIRKARFKSIRSVASDWVLSVSKNTGACIIRGFSICGFQLFMGATGIHTFQAQPEHNVVQSRDFLMPRGTMPQSAVTTAPPPKSYTPNQSCAQVRFRGWGAENHVFQYS